MTKSRTRTAVILGLVPLIAAACSSSGSKGSGGGGGGGASGTLRIGYDLASQFDNTFDPSKATSDCADIVTKQIYGQLIGRNTVTETFDPALGFAQSWDIGAKSLTLHLRPGLKFSDGEALDANAVKVNIENNKKNPQNSSIQNITSIDVIDPLTVRLNRSTTDVLFMLAGLSGKDGDMVAPNHIADANAHPVGAGPYTLTSYTTGSDVTLAKNPTFFDATRIHVPNLKFIQAAVGPPKVNALKAGDLDEIDFLLDSYESLKSNDKFTVASTPSGAFENLQFRLTPGSPLAKLKVRQALEHAVDKQAFNSVVNDGLGEVTDQPFRKGTPGYNPAADGLYPYNPTLAKQMLADAGYPHGFTITVAKPGGGIALMDSESDTLVQQLQAVGVKVNLKPILGGDIATQYYIGKQGDAFAAEVLPDLLPGQFLTDNYSKDQFVAIYSYREDPQITKLANDSLSTSDETKANQLAAQGTLIAVQQAYDLPIAFTPQLQAYDKSKIGNLKAPGSTCDPVDYRDVTWNG
ncbi:MAG TPA: ABC transporter substrate-binding protein [Mycobacteriales bacterium]|nr:ABC transporter substrate-binding protein [Mycobacteriales bacterium]